MNAYTSADIQANQSRNDENEGEGEQWKAERRKNEPANETLSVLCVRRGICPCAGASASTSEVGICTERGRCTESGCGVRFQVRLR